MIEQNCPSNSSTVARKKFYFFGPQIEKTVMGDHKLVPFHLKCNYLWWEVEMECELCGAHFLYNYTSDVDLMQAFNLKRLPSPRPCWPSLGLYGEEILEVFDCLRK